MGLFLLYFTASFFKQTHRLGLENRTLHKRTEKTANNYQLVYYTAAAENENRVRCAATGKCIYFRKHSIARQYINGEAKQEYRYDTTKSYSADVAIFQNDVISSIVEVCASHLTTGESLESRTACVGVNNVWEILAVEILSRQAELFTTANAVEVHSLLNHEPDGCICKWCPGCDEFHIDPNTVCGCEWDEWVGGFDFLTGFQAADIGAAYSHLDSIPT